MAQLTAAPGTVVDGRADLLSCPWSHCGVWERLLEKAQHRAGVKLGMAFLDGTTPGRPESRGCGQKGGSSAQRDEREALGRSRGGFSTKAGVIVDGSGRALGFALAPGQAHELPMAPDLLAFLTTIAIWIVADRGYASHAFRMLIWSLGSRPAISVKRNEAAAACPAWNRHQPQPRRTMLEPTERMARCRDTL